MDMLDWIFSRAMIEACNRLGGALHFLHHAVNAVAQAESFCQRLQVNVRSAHLEASTMIWLTSRMSGASASTAAAVVVQRAAHVDFRLRSIPG